MVSGEHECYYHHMTIRTCDRQLNLDERVHPSNNDVCLQAIQTVVINHFIIIILYIHIYNICV